MAIEHVKNRCEFLKFGKTSGQYVSSSSGTDWSGSVYEQPEKDLQLKMIFHNHRVAENKTTPEERKDKEHSLRLICLKNDISVWNGSKTSGHKRLLNQRRNLWTVLPYHNEWMIHVKAVRIKQFMNDYWRGVKSWSGNQTLKLFWQEVQKCQKSVNFDSIIQQLILLTFL